MKCFFIAIATLFLILISSCFVFAEVSNNHSSDSNLPTDKITLTVAIEEIGYFPYNYEVNGEIKGFTVDILNYFEANSNYDFEFIVLPWARALHLVAQGNVDLILTFFKNPEREKIYNFIEPSYGYEVNQLFTLSETTVKFSGELQQIAPFSIGTKREYSYGEEFDHADFLTKLPAINEAILLKLLLSKRIDIAISNPFIFKKLMLEQGVTKKVKAIEPYVATTPVYLGLTKARQDATEIKNTLGELTTRLKKTPYYQELLKRYQLK